MKALGLSFGRKNRNSDIMVKQVLKQMKARGFEVEFHWSLSNDCTTLLTIDFCCER